jgi:hypothetical protein
VFGILKGRFRILKIPLLLQSKEEIDNVFWTCCILHNRILRKSNEFYLWEKGIDWAGEYGCHDIADLNKKVYFQQFDKHNRYMRTLELRVSRNMDLGVDLFSANISNYQNGSSTVAPDNRAEVELTHSSLRSKLVENFMFRYNNRSIVW